MDTTATIENGSYRLSGTKTFITNGTIASFYAVLCQTDPEASPSYRGLSILIVDREMIGKHFQVNELGEKLGIRLTSSAELVFKSTRLSVTTGMPVSYRYMRVRQRSSKILSAPHFFPSSLVENAPQGKREFDFS
jgi:alkylation response protein AidB-like acyl-CoA dehydrogenase